MAFKFKVKKRPNPLQAALSGFAQGASAGIAAGTKAALTELVEADAKKKQSATTELNLFNTMVSGLPSTEQNRVSLINARLAIGRGDVTATEAIESLKDSEFQFKTTSEQEKESEKQEAQDIASVEAMERQTQQQIGMIGLKPPEHVVEQRTKPPTKRATYQAADGYRYYVDTGERVFPDVVKPRKEAETTITKNQELTRLENAIESAQTSQILARDQATKDKIAMQIEKFKQRRDQLLLGESQTTSDKQIIDY